MAHGRYIICEYRYGKASLLEELPTGAPSRGAVPKRLPPAYRLHWDPSAGGKAYDAGYEPIKDSSGVIGAYFVGYLK